MKNLTKIFALSACFLMVSFISKAQTYVGIGIKAGIPIGDFAEYAGFGLGGGIALDHMAGENVSLGFSAGYIAFFDNEIAPNVTGSSIVIPLLANVRYYFGDGSFTPLIGLGIGYTLVTQISNVELAGTTNEFTDDYNGFTINPHVGIRYAPNDKIALFITGDYNYILNEVEVDLIQEGDPVTGGPDVVALDPYAFIGINVGLSFNISK